MLSVLSITTILSLNIMVGLILASNNVIAERTGGASASVTVPDACTMTGTGMNSHSATINPNTYSASSGSPYENGIGKTTLTAICNDDNGFSIYAIGFTGNSYDSDNHTKLIGENTGSTIITKTYATGDTASNWSMKVTKVDNPVSGDPVTYHPENYTIQSDAEGTFSSWHSIPATYTKVAEYHASTGSSTTDTTLGAKLETTYAAYISSSQPADTYVGQVKYTMVHPYTEVPLQPQISPSGKICYYANASDAEGTMGCQNITSSPTLLASNFSRAGYGFAGWSDSYDYATNPNVKFYGPQETMIIPDPSIYYIGEGKGLSLYAVWIKSQGSIQNRNRVASICNSLTAAPTDGEANLSSVSAFTDQRDRQTYAVAKLADGNCWMIENLRLENDAKHNNDGTLAQGYGASAIYGNFVGLANPESTGFLSIYSANSLYSDDGNNNTIKIGTSDFPANRMPRYNNLNTTNRAQNNPNSNTFVDDNTTGGMYSYGNYYTWHAAIADVASYVINNYSVTETSLCPVGWHLPKGGDKTVIESGNNDFWNLAVIALNGNVVPANYDNSYLSRPYYSGTVEVENLSNKLRSYPNNFIYSGYFQGKDAAVRGSYSGYWSSTVTNNEESSYQFRLSNNAISPGTINHAKSAGHPIRCMVDF